jgi:predicted MFS family arabinose efflux permease
MADSDKVTGQALITGAVSLAGMFSYLTGGLMVSAWGAMRGLLLVTLVGMAGGALFILFAVRDQKQTNTETGIES